MQDTLVKIPIVWGLISLDFHGQIKFESQNFIMPILPNTVNTKPQK